MDYNIQKYIAFVQTAESGSFTKAAAQLSYAQSSVSKMVQDLEREWKLPLLERTHSGVRLTSSGRELLPYAQALIADHRRLLSHVGELNGLQTGSIRIATFASVAIHWLPELFAKFQRDYPGIEYEMLLGDYDEIEAWLRSGRVDIGFLSLPAPSGLDAVFLQNDAYLVVFPEGHPFAQETAIDIHALEGQPFLLLEHGGRTEVTRLLETHRVHPDIRFTTWEDFAIMSMVEKGLGVSILPEIILQRIPYRILSRPLKQPFYRKIGLALKDRDTLSPAARKFLTYLPIPE